MGPRPVRLAGAALTLLVAGGFVCRQDVSTPPTPLVVTSQTPDSDAATRNENTRQTGPCGELGLPCCEGDQCNGRTTCLEGSCVSCGAPGAIRCNTGESCDPWAQANESTDLCEPCGSHNQLCCSGPESEYCRDGERPPVGCTNTEGGYFCRWCPTDGGVCPVMLQRHDAGVSMGHNLTLCGPTFVRNADGVCVTCGRSGGPCCRNSVCLLPLSCSRGGICESGLCGRVGLPCCRNDRCVVGHCRAGACRL